MSAVDEKTEVTPEDLIAMPREKDDELVDGQLVVRRVSVLSSWAGGGTLFLPRANLKDHPTGLFFHPEPGFRCVPDAPRKVRRADVSCIKRERPPEDWRRVGDSRPAPDLAVEVDEKLHEDLKAGVSPVWVVNPEIRTDRVHRADFTSAYLTQDDDLSGEGVLPGFVSRVGALFPSTAAAAPEVAGR